MPLIKTRGKKLNHAIVIGGRIAGLLSARVLADRFASVTIVETDNLPELPSARINVPQSVQPPILFTKGYRILVELFPEIAERLKIEGALSVDWTRFKHFSHGGWRATSNCDSNLTSVSCSRPLLKWSIRQQLVNYPNVQFASGHRFNGSLMHQEQRRIAGVLLRANSGESRELAAFLVVDTRSRRSQARQWLQKLGFASPETIINPFLGYATRRYKQREGFKSDWKVMLISHSLPKGTRLGYLAKIENGEWIATLGGYSGDFPPTSDRGFLDFARSLPSLEFYEAIKDAEGRSRIYAHRVTKNRLRHYEKINLPQGFVALGDSVCALCPVYGQGMTVSAIATTILRDWLNQNSNLTNLQPVRFQKRLAKSNSLAWMLATGQDLRFATT